MTSLSLTLAAPFVVYSGYGSMAEFIALGMKRTGATVNIIPHMIDYNGLLPETVELVKQSNPNPDDPVLFFHWPDQFLEQFEGHPNLFIYTTWESDTLASAWVEKLNRAKAVITPSRFAARIFKESGVKPPVCVVPQGVDPDIYPYVERPGRDTFTTLMVTLMVERKHWSQAVEAWFTAFNKDNEARLIVKSHFQQYPRDMFMDPRVEYHSANEPSRGILHWYQQADVLLALGSEGFGLPLVEGMATGLPVVTYCGEAQGDVCEDAPDLILPVQPEHYIPYTSLNAGTSGLMGVPSEKEAARQLQWVANNRDQARQMGRKASVWAHTHRNVWDTGPGLLRVIQQHLS